MDERLDALVEAFEDLAALGVHELDVGPDLQKLGDGLIERPRLGVCRLPPCSAIHCGAIGIHRCVRAREGAKRKGA